MGDAPRLRARGAPQISGVLGIGALSRGGRRYRSTGASTSRDEPRCPDPGRGRLLGLVHRTYPLVPQALLGPRRRRLRDDLRWLAAFPLEALDPASLDLTALDGLTWGAAAYSALCSSAFGFAAWGWGVSHVGANRVLVYQYLVTPSG